MLLEFQGAARTVTGSMHILEANGRKILLDCGLFQGHRKEAFERNRHFPFDPGRLHSVILSHAHIDHSGNLPQLVKEGFLGDIYCTPATADLCEHMLRDAAHIQEKDVEYVNRKRRREKRTPFEPLYTGADAEKCLDHLVTIPYDTEFEAGIGVRAAFRDAGHILGSAWVQIDIDEGDGPRRLVFTGDVGRPHSPILRDPVPIEEAEILISESTYGDRLHEGAVNLKEQLRDALQTACSRRGRVLIPAFSVGRTQNIVHTLHQLCHEGALPDVPIFVDSPLSANVTDVFRRHPECYDRETMKYLEMREDPFGFYRLAYVRTREESMALNERPGPFITLAASGMCESGRVLHHLKYVAPHPQNMILVVGFMAEHTLGRRIADGVESIKLYGEEYPLRAEIRKLDGFSAHADRDELLRFFGRLRRPPRRTFLVHGELEQAQGLARRLGEHGFPRVDIPERGQKFDFGPESGGKMKSGRPGAV